MRRNGWKLISTALAAAGMSCGGPASGPSSAPSPRPSSGVVGAVEAVRFAPDTAHYRVASHLTIEQEVNGQIQHGGMELVYYLTVRLVPDGERLRASLVVDSLPRYAGPGAVDPTVSSARGAVFHGFLTPAGELSAFHASDSSIRFVRELAGELQNFFPRILAAGVLPGQRWVDTTEQQTTASMIPLTMRFIGEHEVGEPDTIRSILALPIRSKVGYSFSGTGAQGGQEFRVEGTGRRAVIEYLGLDGRYLGLSTADSSSFTITLPSVGMTIPGKQTRADTVAVVP